MEKFMQKFELINLAKNNPALANKLREIAKLENYLSMPVGQIINIEALGQKLERESLKETRKRYDNLFDEVYNLLGISKQESEEFGVWLSYNVQEIVKALSRKRWQLGKF